MEPHFLRRGSFGPTFAEPHTTPTRKPWIVFKHSSSSFLVPYSVQVIQVGPLSVWHCKSDYSASVLDDWGVDGWPLRFAAGHVVAPLIARICTTIVIGE